MNNRGDQGNHGSGMNTQGGITAFVNQRIVHGYCSEWRRKGWPHSQEGSTHPINWASLSYFLRNARIEDGFYRAGNPTTQFPGRQVLYINERLESYPQGLLALYSEAWALSPRVSSSSSISWSLISNQVQRWIAFYGVAKFDKVVVFKAIVGSALNSRCLSFSSWIKCVRRLRSSTCSDMNTKCSITKHIPLFRRTHLGTRAWLLQSFSLLSWETV